ncbi:MAG: gamma-glutamyltransferase family protein [Rhodospirillaceae bacterium]
MLNTTYGRRGLVVAPHQLAAQAGLAVLREGGDAIEAVIAAAATCSVVYPHMNGLGGDGFWMIHELGKPPIGIMATGVVGQNVGPELYRKNKLSEMPGRGPLACNTVAGTVAGWTAALEISRARGGRLPLARLLQDAILHARDGVPVCAGLAGAFAADGKELLSRPGFGRVFMPGGKAPVAGALMTQPALAKTLERLAAAGTDDFYRGELAGVIASELKAAGSPLTREDLAAHQARPVHPLTVRLRGSTLYNLPPPTQGLASLMILGLFDRMEVPEAGGYLHVHCLVEATKHAGRVREGFLTDPAYMRVEATDFLLPEVLDEVAAAVDRSRASPYFPAGEYGDTVWLGAVDSAGRVVSCMQSLCWAFGSGVALERTGVLWHNRGVGFSLQPGAFNALIPGRRPFHTLNPALAVFDDGRVMAYGAMGGEGQPQTQAMVFSRYARFGEGLQAAVTAPRWFLGRRRGKGSVSLKLEDRFPPEMVEWLRLSGHELEIVEPFSDLMGHAGAIVRSPSGTIEGAYDPRSDGAVAAW